MHSYNPSVQEAEAGQSRVQGQPRVHGKTQIPLLVQSAQRQPDAVLIPQPTHQLGWVQGWK